MPSSNGSRQQDWIIAFALHGRQSGFRWARTRTMRCLSRVRGRERCRSSAGADLDRTAHRPAFGIVDLLESSCDGASFIEIGNFRKRPQGALECGGMPPLLTFRNGKAASCRRTPRRLRRINQGKFPSLEPRAATSSRLPPFCNIGWGRRAWECCRRPARRRHAPGSMQRRG
jgi:hypothetical protein